MSLTTSQLSQLLDVFSEPARITDANGAVLAQNQRAQQMQAPLEFNDSFPLEDGVFLRRRTRSVLSGRIGFDVLARELMHEVRNPLSAIMTASQLVQSTPEANEETRMLLEVISSESARINRILRDFSDYLKMPHAQPVEMDVAHLARRLISQLQKEEVLPADLAVQNELPDKLPVLADENLVERALSGILRNAAESSGEDRIMRLWGEDGSPVKLCVEDNGPGFNAGNAEKAFEPFFSTDAKRTGLGLSVARAAIEACQGRVWLENLGESTPGARVCIELPRA